MTMAFGITNSKVLESCPFCEYMQKFDIMMYKNNPNKFLDFTS